MTGRYTLVVWTGRADGAPREGVTGREGALPLLFRLADGLERIEPGLGLARGRPHAAAGNA